MEECCNGQTISSIYIGLWVLVVAQMPMIVPILCRLFLKTLPTAWGTFWAPCLAKYQTQWIESRANSHRPHGKGVAPLTLRIHAKCWSHPLATTHHPYTQSPQVPTKNMIKASRNETPIPKPTMSPPCLPQPPQSAQSWPNARNGSVARTCCCRLKRQLNTSNEEIQTHLFHLSAKNPGIPMFSHENQTITI